MKTLGLVGGTSWVSTAEYYGHLNRLVNKKLGGDEAAKLILYSLNFGEICRNNANGDLSVNGKLVVDAAERLAKAGAQGLMLCANTMHMYADQVEAATGLPVIHIAHAVAEEIKRRGMSKVLLLGTKYTMEMPFYSDILQGYGIEVMIPDDADRAMVHARIFEELTKDVFTESTREDYRAVMRKAMDNGAECVILGCTEIPLLFDGHAIPLPGLDTALVHSEAAVKFALDS
ncbi:aspartate/glutamate racemase family protein [Geitlerinema splendidum]|nr:aspartate/glutamate racemase family protein [Geitlerinema splendidum]